MKIVLRVRYNGTKYAGFQYQPNAVTIQQRLNEACKAAFGLDCDVTGCSRTDSGVHAKEFVCAVTPQGMPGFETVPPIPEGKIHRVVGRYLPDDIAIRGAVFADDSFHPRYDVCEKEYVYRIYTGLCRDPFLSSLVYQLPLSIDSSGVDIMQKCATEFVGKHDFAAFMASGSDVVDTVRTVKAARVEKTDDEILFYVSADGFLYNMVRIMTGTLIDAAAGRISPEDIRRAIATGDRSLLGRTAPACGLYLNRVIYEKELNWKAE